MASWTSDELNKIGGAEEIDIRSLRRDDTLGNPTTIWVVRVGDGLYIRCINGREGRWFRATQVRKEGRILAGSIGRDVIFQDTDPGLNDQIDEAFRKKYGHYEASIVNTDLTPSARESTLKLLPK